MKKNSISPEKAKFTSSLIVGIVFMSITFLASSFYTKKMMEKVKAEYFKSLNSSTEGFSKIISSQLSNYRDVLNTFYVHDVFEDEDTAKISAFLKKYHYKKHEDFIHLYYLIPDGTAYLSNGTIYKMHPERHEGFSGKTDLYISDLITEPEDNKYAFCIEQTLYDKENKVYGILGASVSIDSLMKKTLGLKLGSKESFMVLDRQGVFLLHQRKDVIGKTYTPEDERFSNTATPVMAKAPPMTILTKADDGKEIYVVTSKIKEAGWTLSVKASMEEIDEIYKPQKQTGLLILLFSLVIIVALVLIESKVMDFFQRKQLIATVYDPLTNLWTRQRFEREAQKALKTNRHSKFLLIEADIRGFKFINQNYGEDAADQVLISFANSLNTFAQNYHAIIGRGFADRFYIFLKITSIHKAMQVIKTKTSSFQNKIQNNEIPFFPKYGIAFYKPEDNSNGVTVQTLIGQASFAKSTIKDNAMVTFAVYNSKMLEKVQNERFLENHMQNALENEEFFIMYQPKISLVDDKLVGAEALVRWKSKDLGIIMPDTFIPLFEKNGFITKLDYFVYDKVFSFIEQSLKAGRKMVPISVNMSRNHNKPDKFIHDFMEIFNKYNIPSNLIQVEILERSVMDNTTLEDITNKLHKEGFSVAMDDFGSGESSLNMLTKIPVDVLKFDREFLSASTDKNGNIEKKSEKFINILIDLSKNLEKETVFEGVETQAQRDFLRSVNCDQAQGFFYSKPLSENDFIDFIKMNI